MIHHICYQFFSWVSFCERRIFRWRQKWIIFKFQDIRVIRRDSLQNTRNPDRLLIVGLNWRACNLNPVALLQRDSFDSRRPGLIEVAIAFTEIP